MEFAEPQIVTMTERITAGLSQRFTMDSVGEIPALWAGLHAREWIVPDETPGALFGVSYEFDGGGGFNYLAGVEVSQVGVVPRGVCHVVLAAGDYAVFSHRGAMAEIPQLFTYIFQNWLPASGYISAEAPVFERYPSGPADAEGRHAYEVWAPIRKV